MYQLIYKSSHIGQNGPSGIIPNLRLRGQCAKWNHENSKRTGKTMHIQTVDDTVIAYIEFDNEDQAALFKLTYL